MQQNLKLLGALHGVTLIETDGAILSDLATRAEAYPPPAQTANYVTAMGYFAQAGSDYAEGEIPDGNAQMINANAMIARITASLIGAG